MVRSTQSIVRHFVKEISIFYRWHGRDLPWRKENITPYEVWVSEIMLQQTQVSRVVEYYGRFLERFPNVEALARTNWEEFLPYYEGLGYYNRGRNMLACARVVMEEYNGKFPCEVEELERLPGVGPYTARAVASFACGAKTLAWDTNFSRVFGRYLKGSKNENVEKEEIEEEIQKICEYGGGVDSRKSLSLQGLPLQEGEKIFLSQGHLPLRKREDQNSSPFCDNDEKESEGDREGCGNNKREMGGVMKKEKRDQRNELQDASFTFRDFNAAVMDFGSLVCKKNPKCGECPLNSHCVYFQNGGKKEKTTAHGNDAFPLQEAQAFVILHENHKKYFSSAKHEFQPFVLEKGRVSREDIKEFFFSKHGLKTSVRPPKMKIYIDEEPTIVVYAQILSGEHNFFHFEPKAVRDMINTWL